jgi:hypothetical protein
MAEEEGFEPSVGLLLRLISSPLIATSQDFTALQINDLERFALHWTSQNRYAVDTLLTLFRILLASMKNANYINTDITHTVNQDVVRMNDYFAACRHARTAYK